MRLCAQMPHPPERIKFKLCDKLVIDPSLRQLSTFVGRNFPVFQNVFWMENSHSIRHQSAVRQKKLRRLGGAIIVTLFPAGQ